VIHRKVRDRRKDLLHQISHRLTTKADVLKVKTLNVRGMARNHHLALSVADAGMSRLVTFCEYKADWRGRQVEKIDPWFPGSQTCCGGAEIHREMRNLKERMMRCNCGNVMGARPKRRREPLLVSRGAGEPHRKRCNAHGHGKSGASSGARR
jgi:IS605 OrfB family transposase